MEANPIWKLDPEIRASWVLARRLLVATIGPDRDELIHCERVARLSEQIGLRLGLTQPLLHDCVVGALVHDIGKVVVPTEVLQWPGGLSEREYELVKTHPTVGATILRSFPGLARFADVVERHHERLDGSGYPRGLRGEAIDIASRIVAISDVFDAVTSARPYRAAMPVSRALAVLQIDVDLGRLDAEVFAELADICHEASSPVWFVGLDAA